MGRPTRSGSKLRSFELQHIEHILSISRNTTNAAWSLGVTLRSLHILFARAEISQRKPGKFELHPLSKPELSLREFRRAVIQESIARLGTVGASKELGTSTKTIYLNMDKIPPKTTMERKDDVFHIPAKIGRPRKTPRPGDLPVSFKNQKPDLPIIRNDATREKMEVSVWVSPEERDHYYNLDFLWGTYGSRTENPTERTLHHALGFGEDL